MMFQSLQRYISVKAWCNIANRDTASCHLSGQHEELRVVLSGTALTIRQSVDTINVAYLE